MSNNIKLPPLPKASKMHDIPGYDEEELKGYARAAVLADRASQDPSPPAEGGEIMVSTPYNVFILPLRPSGLLSGPRFVVHVPGPEQPAAHPAITHCDNCGCDWLDNGLNPVGCPYCKQHDERIESESNYPIKYYKQGGVIYAVHGTSSINCVERLLAKIADLESELENERTLRTAALDTVRAAREERDALRKVLGKILENEASDYKAAEEYGGYVLDDELREEARAVLAKWGNHE